MVNKSIFLCLFLVVDIANAATEKKDLSDAEFAVVLATQGQVFQQYINKALNFNKNVRPYTNAENKDFTCNGIYLLKENIKFSKQYPQYATIPAVKEFVAINQQQIDIWVNHANKFNDNKKCLNSLVYLPLEDNTSSKPLIITANDSSQIFINYYQERERLINEINLALNEPQRIKKMCELLQLGVITNMDKISFYNLSRTSEGKKALVTIDKDERNLRSKLGLHKCF